MSKRWTAMRRIGWSTLALLVLWNCSLAAEPVQLPNDALVAGIPGTGPLTVAQIDAWYANPGVHEPLTIALPLGLAAASNQVVGLDTNPLTRAKIELGRQLYFDPRLSADATVSCASCHHPDEGFSRHTRFGVGIRQQQGGRNSPVSYNRILSSLQFWDGRAASLEEQALGPIQNPIEMGNTHAACMTCLKGIPGYVRQFQRVFGPEGMTIENVAQAIAAFERVLVTGPSPYDYSEAYARYTKLDPSDLQDLLEADADAKTDYEQAKANAAAHPLSDSARRGQELFFSERVNCAACHVGANLADEKYHNIGVGMDAKDPDLGRYVVTKDDKDWGAFKTPTIRNVALSAPYMHDGSLQTLLEVVEHYAKGGIPNKNLSDKVRKIDLTPQEKQDLVAFMEACTGAFPKVEAGRLPE